MKRVIYLAFIITLTVLFSSCQQNSIYDGSTDRSKNENQKLEDVVFVPSKNEIPTLVVVMNWTNYSETDPLIWHNKIFNKQENSINRWYYDSTNVNIELVPVTESSGSANDGVIIVSMGKSHPGGQNDVSFRDTEIRNAITSVSVVNSVDFAALDTDSDGILNRRELQIIFVVAGGEEAYGDSPSKSIWAHAWAFDSAPQVDGVFVMQENNNSALSGSYMRFGATHNIDTSSAHKATIGVAAHEIGHSLLALDDLYDDEVGAGSGLGYYAIMSGGAWAKKTIDTYDGQTPVQFSVFSKIDSGIDINVTQISTTVTSKIVTIKCSSNEAIKLNTTQSNEYFLLECRDTTKIDSDRAFKNIDSGFTDNKLFALIYHIDENKPTDSSKLPNAESGAQTPSNHYMVRLIERDNSSSLTSNTNIQAKISDAYTDGYTIDTTKTKTYAGVSGYNIVVQSSDYTARTMTFKITR